MVAVFAPVWARLGSGLVMNSCQAAISKPSAISVIPPPQRGFCPHGYPVGAFNLLMVAAVGHADEILHGPFLSSAHRHTMNLASNRQLPGCE